jgi:hypothetical protein
MQGPHLAGFLRVPYLAFYHTLCRDIKDMVGIFILRASHLLELMSP